MLFKLNLGPEVFRILTDSILSKFSLPEGNYIRIYGAKFEISGGRIRFPE
jgi:hypothetical protein